MGTVCDTAPESSIPTKEVCMNDLKKYSRPVLRRLGSVEDVTQQSPGDGPDGGQPGYDHDGGPY